MTDDDEDNKATIRAPSLSRGKPRAPMLLIDPVDAAAPSEPAPAPPEPTPAPPEPTPAPSVTTPTPPADRPSPRLDDGLQPLDPRAVTLWRVGGAISTLIWSGLIAVAAAAAFFVLDAGWEYLAAGAVTLIVLNAVVRIAVVPPIRYRLWRYQLREDQLFLRRGFLVIRSTLIPLVRVQNVDTVQGPVSRYFGLWSVVVFTAANAQSIPALSKEQADHLRESIAELARRARDE